jgi:hypothetical protein
MVDFRVGDHGDRISSADLKPIFPFRIGEQYSRSEDIHKPFDGQRRGGICTPKSVPAVFLFTGKSGDQFGYVDKWIEDQTIYSFAGEGQEGDMKMKGGIAPLAGTRRMERRSIYSKLSAKGNPFAIWASSITSITTWFQALTSVEREGSS